MKHLLTLALLLPLPLAVLCQQQKDTKVNKDVDSTKTNTYIVEYDFQKGRYTSNNLKIKVNHPVSFKISNINRLAYSVEVKAKDTIIAETNFSNLPFSANDLSALAIKSKFGSLPVNPALNSQTETITKSEISDEIKKIKKNGKEDEQAIRDSINSIKKDLESISKSTELTERITAAKNQVSLLQNRIQLLQDTIRNHSAHIEDITKRISTATDTLKAALEKQKEVSDAALAKLTDKNTTLNKTLNDLNSTKKNLEDQYAKIETLKNEALAKFKNDNDQFIAAFEKFKFCYFQAKKAIVFYRDVKLVAENPLLSNELFQNIYKKDFDTLKSQLPYLKHEVSKFENLYTDLEVLYSYLNYNPSLGDVLNFGGQVKLYAHSNGLKIIADKMFAFIKDTDVRALMGKIEQTIDFLLLPEAFHITFSPVQPINDAVVFDVKINKKAGNTSELYNNMNFKHQEYTRGGTRLDFSIGLAGSYFNNTPVYELETKKVENSDASTITIAQKADHLIVPSLVGMATMSWRKVGYFAFGESAGLGIDVVNGKIQLSNFYIGPSIIVGKHERVTFTAGATFRNVGQLSAGYDINSPVQGPTDKISNFMTDKYKIGLFASVSINLTKGIKDNIKQLKSAL